MNLVRGDRCGRDMWEHGEAYMVKTAKDGSEMVTSRVGDLCPQCVEMLWEWVASGNEADR